ncbi:hypothetical protein NFI96_007060 [Prochilodus magdalenae]|nr:hypothetical protein NFI96_007060 [Prochilodus magdalenae]
MTLRLMCAAILVLVAHLGLTDAAVRVWGMRASGLKGDPVGHPDPYLKVWCASTFGGMTEFYKDNGSPAWSAQFYFPSCGINDIVKLEVWDKDLNFDDHLGTCTSRVVSGTHFNVYCGVGKGSWGLEESAGVEG